MIGKILFRLFALCGMTLTCVACYGTGYDEYHAEFGASGRVVDPENNPIEGIEVSFSNKRVRTTEDGRFYIHARDINANTLILSDVDGEANGGEFADKYITLHRPNADLGDIELTKID